MERVNAFSGLDGCLKSDNFQPPWAAILSAAGKCSSWHWSHLAEKPSPLSQLVGSLCRLLCCHREATEWEGKLAHSAPLEVGPGWPATFFGVADINQDSRIRWEQFCWCGFPSLELPLAVFPGAEVGMEERCVGHRRSGQKPQLNFVAKSN